MSKWKLGELKVGDEVYCNDIPEIKGKIEQVLEKGGEIYAVKMMRGVIVEESMISLKSNPDPEILHEIKFTLPGQHKRWIQYVGEFNDWLRVQEIPGIKIYRGSVPLLDQFTFEGEEIICDSYRQDEPSMDLLLHLIFQAGKRAGSYQVTEAVKSKLGL